MPSSRRIRTVWYLPAYSLSIVLFADPLLHDRISKGASVDVTAFIDGETLRPRTLGLIHEVLERRVGGAANPHAGAPTGVPQAAAIRSVNHPVRFGIGDE